MRERRSGILRGARGSGNCCLWWCEREKEVYEFIVLFFALAPIHTAHRALWPTVGTKKDTNHQYTHREVDSFCPGIPVREEAGGQGKGL